MRKLMTAALLVSFVVAACATSGITRTNGLSAHLVPKRVASLDKSGKVKWGFMVSQSKDLRPTLERPVFQSAQALLDHFATLSEEIQENGIWLVVTHPDAYGEDEKAEIEQLKSLSAQRTIPLFICRGSELPDGWKRFS